MLAMLARSVFPRVGDRACEGGQQVFGAATRLRGKRVGRALKVCLELQQLRRPPT